jgi:hypothetical protein
MISADEFRKSDSQIKFSLKVFKARPLGLKTVAVAPDLEWSGTSYELNLSGSQVLVVMSVLGAVGLLIWALLKLWLYE